MEQTYNIKGHLGSLNASHDLYKVGKVQSMNSSLEKDTPTVQPIQMSFDQTTTYPPYNFVEQ
jgi:hypothetical protein